MLLREYQPSDAESLAAIYRDAVIGIGSSAYDDKQIEAWSSYPEDIEEFRRVLSEGLTIVVLHDGKLVAFGQLNPLARIAFVYTASQFARLGYATEIYKRLEAKAIEQAVQRLYTEASRISKHFFLKMGFCVVEAEIVYRKGVQLERFKMAKIIG
ncbi:MAG TPA: GNAT family N-acetyltransferase [Allocoleopsis sp.]